MTLDPGRLDRRIVLERRDSSRDGFGQDVATWVPLATVWARVEPLTGREPFGASQRFAEATHKFTIRWRAGLDPIHRIITHDGRAYDIVELLEIGRREGLAILATARAETPTP